jgi:hypothetical protein
MGDENSALQFAQYYKHVGRVLENPERFKVKADIGAKAYAYLSKAENLEKYARALVTGVAVTGAGLAAWYASLGLFGKVMLGVGILSTPVFLWAALGASATAATLAAVKFLGQQEDDHYHRIPKFISCPLDLLASIVAELFLPPCVVLFGESEKAINHLVKEWGYDRVYLEALRHAVLANPDKFILCSRAEVLGQKMPKQGHVECSLIAKDLLQVCESEGEISDARLRKLYEVFADLLRHKKDASLYALRQVEHLVRGFDIPEPQEVPQSGFGARIRVVVARIGGKTRALLSRN